MISGSVVFYKIATTCLLILVGYVMRRLRLLPDIAVNVVSKYLLYLGLPCYVIYYMPTSVDAKTLAANWYFPLIGALLVCVADLFGYVAARLWARPGERATFRILVGLPNWMFMALAVCEPLFREDGVRVLLLFNIGITFYLWTFGMTSFRSGATLGGMAKQLFLNPQNVAMAIGLALALAMPFLRGMEKLSSEELARLPLFMGILSPFWETVYLLGSTALPLSIFQIGLLLGSPVESGLTPSTGPRSLVLTCVLRLVAVPVLSMAVLCLLARCGLRLSFAEFMVSVIVMAMPPAVMITAVVDVYGGVGRLAARGILWGTIASLATAPAITWLAQKTYALF